MIKELSLVKEKLYLLSRTAISCQEHLFPINNYFMNRCCRCNKKHSNDFCNARVFCFYILTYFFTLWGNLQHVIESIPNFSRHLILSGRRGPIAYNQYCPNYPTFFSFYNDFIYFLLFFGSFVWARSSGLLYAARWCPCVTPCLLIPFLTEPTLRALIYSFLYTSVLTISKSCRGVRPLVNKSVFL